MLYFSVFCLTLCIVLSIEEAVRHHILKSHEADPDNSSSFARTSAKNAKNNTPVTTEPVAVEEQRYIYDFSTETLVYLQGLLFQSNTNVPWRKVKSKMQDSLGIVFPFLVSHGEKAEEESTKLKIEIDKSQSWLSLKEKIRESAFEYKEYPFDCNKPYNYFTHRKREKIDSATNPYFYYPYKKEAWTMHKNEFHTTVYIPVSKICPEDVQRNMWQVISKTRNGKDNLDHNSLVYFVSIIFKGHDASTDNPSYADITIEVGIGCLGATRYNSFEYLEVIKPMCEELIWETKEPYHRTYAIQDVVRAFREDIPAALSELTDLQNAGDKATSLLTYLLSNRNSADYKVSKYCNDAFQVWAC